MGRDRVRAWLLVTLVALTACGGSGDVAPMAEAARAGVATPDADRRLVVVHLDWDGDTHLDVLTLDAARDPLVIVEGIRGAPGGRGEDATDAWRGCEIDRTLSDALQVYLADSCSVASQTDLELILDGTPVVVTVIE